MENAKNLLEEINLLDPPSVSQSSLSSSPRYSSSNTNPPFPSPSPDVIGGRDPSTSLIPPTNSLHLSQKPHTPNFSASPTYSSAFSHQTTINGSGLRPQEHRLSPNFIPNPGSVHLKFGNFGPTHNSRHPLTMPGVGNPLPPPEKDGLFDLEWGEFATSSASSTTMSVNSKPSSSPIPPSQMTLDRNVDGHPKLSSGPMDNLYPRGDSTSVSQSFTPQPHVNSGLLNHITTGHSKTASLSDVPPSAFGPISAADLIRQSASVAPSTALDPNAFPYQIPNKPRSYSQTSAAERSTAPKRFSNLSNSVVPSNLHLKSHINGESSASALLEEFSGFETGMGELPPQRFQVDRGDGLPDFSLNLGLPPTIERVKAPPQQGRRRTDTSERQLNGFIRHEEIPALIEVEPEMRGVSSVRSNERGSSGMESEKNSLLSPRDKSYFDINKSSSSEESDDDVFHSGQWSKGKKEEELDVKAPLMPPSNRSRRQRKSGSRGSRLQSILSRETPPSRGVDEDGSEYGMKIQRSGWSWRSRMLCVLSFLLANLALGLIVAGIVHYSGGSIGKLLGLKAFKGPLDLCSEIESTYVTNATLHTTFIYFVNHLRTIKSKHDWLILIPYAGFCADEDNCKPGGVTAVYGDKMKRAWEYRSASSSSLSSFTCGSDLNHDNVPDCAVVYKPYDARVEMLSGADGSLITSWDAKGWEAFRPVWAPDTNSDGSPELLVTRQNGNMEIQLWKSDDRKDPTHISERVHYQPANNGFQLRPYSVNLSLTAVPGPAVLWRSEDGEMYVVARIVGRRGLYSWRYADIVRSDASSMGKMIFEDYELGTGFFVDLDKDGVAEYVSCDQQGGLIALNKNKEKRIWKYTMDDHRCSNTSIAFRRNVESKRMDIVAYFYNSNSFKMVLINGKTGKRVDKVPITDDFVPTWAPVTLRPDTKTHSSDFVITWTRTKSSNGRLRLLGGKSSKNMTNLYETELYTPEEGKEEEEEEVVKGLNERNTGTFYVENGTVNFFFVNNVFDNDAEDTEKWKVMIHKVKLSCKCASKSPDNRRNCGNFSDNQPWSAYRGKFGDSTYWV